MATLGLSPGVYWRMTLPEFFAALDRWNEQNADPNDVEPVLADELAQLMEQFPDG